MLRSLSVLVRAVLSVAVIVVGMVAAFLLSDRVDGPWNVLVFAACVLATFVAAGKVAWSGGSTARTRVGT